MKELYKLYSNPVTECLEQRPKDDNNGILDKYLATKKNFKTLQERTQLLQKSIAGKTENENDIKQKLNENEFSLRTSEVIEALGGFSPRKLSPVIHNNDDRQESLANRQPGYEKNKELEKSIEYIDNALKSVKETILSPSTVSNTTTYLEEEQEDYIRQSSSDGRFGDEKMDKPKECDSASALLRAPIRNAQKPSDRVEKILKMVEIDYKPPEKLESIVAESSEDDFTTLRSPFDIAYWDQQFQKYSYYAFIVLVCTLFLLSILRSTNYVFKTLKKYFDKVLLHCWSWIRGIFAPSHTASEQNVLLFIVLTPFIILLLIAYSGFSILYFMNKVLLARVPNSIAQQFNMQNVRGLDCS